MHTFEVNTPTLEDQFYALPHTLYRDNANWQAPLGNDLDQVFNPNKNSLYKHGNLKRWIALDKWNNIAGRIAAFYSHNEGGIKGGFGFFECTEDFEVAKSLLDAALAWLQANGSTHTEGPVNFGEKDRFWGLLTEGFDTPGLYLENYNPSYYADHFRRYGLAEKDTIYTYRVALTNIPQARLAAIAARLQSRHSISFRYFSSDRHTELAHHLHAVYAHSFQENNRLRLLTPGDILELLHLAKPVLSDELIWLAYKDGQPIGFLAFMKDLNQVMRRQEATILKGFGLAVLPAYQKAGVELGLAYALFEALNQQGKPYELYFTGINRNTKAMASFMQNLHAGIYKTHTTWIPTNAFSN